MTYHHLFSGFDRTTTMAFIYHLQLELHDSLYFATREIGRLYETEPIIHNYALCYALGLVDNPQYATTVNETESYRYFCRYQVPQYEEHLTPLNQQGLYVTPAYPVHYQTVLTTWKYANNNYHVEMQKTAKNWPSFGRNKEVAPESKFECFAISSQKIRFPKWIRLGKWLSKAEVTCNNLQEVKASVSEQEFFYRNALNPLDVMFSHQVISYDVINMPPVSLIRNVHLRGSYYQIDIQDDSRRLRLKLPAGMAYQFAPR
nr:type I-D CRISPR-associated protein Cas5/Csc1 [Roseofilum sp. Belize Diploria]